MVKGNPQYFGFIRQCHRWNVAGALITAFSGFANGFSGTRVASGNWGDLSGHTRHERSAN
jgi:hypothetical protein